MARLGVNVDHVATLRQARGGSSPDPVAAARDAEAGGADGIVFHLREDRRHIQDADVRALRRGVRTRLCFEMAPTTEMIGICLDVGPEIATLVPEKRRELTTEGGLDVAARVRTVREAVRRLTRGGIPVSLFVDPDPRQVRAAAATGARFLELHTGDYANEGARRIERRRQLLRLRRAAAQAHALGMKVNAGHGLHYANARAVARLPHVQELNIGHSIVARALFVGFRQAVREMVQRVG